MNNLTRCNKCNGAKKIVGLGLIEHTCSECLGSGYIISNDEPTKTEIDKKTDTVNSLHADNSVHVSKKRGRPKKI